MSSTTSSALATASTTSMSHPNVAPVTRAATINLPLVTPTRCSTSCPDRVTPSTAAPRTPCHL
uniref:Uncharacterized protein n=1 Tax=Arundo donax TaxID=35708 RepID=A0A0A8Y4A0_ARUDO